jgi:hypothetical protein
MLQILREVGKDETGHKLVEAECSWCFSVKQYRTGNVARQDSCGCVKRGSAYVLAERRKNLWDKHKDSKDGPLVIWRRVMNRHKISA